MFFYFYQKKNENIFIWFYLCATGFGLAEIKEYKKFFFKCFFKLVHFLFYTQKNPNVLSCLLSLSNCNWTWANEMQLKLKTNCFVRKHTKKIAIGKKKQFFWKIKTFFECFFVDRCHGAFSPLHCAEVDSELKVQNIIYNLLVFMRINYRFCVYWQNTQRIIFPSSKMLVDFFFRKPSQEVRNTAKKNSSYESVKF